MVQPLRSPDREGNQGSYIIHEIKHNTKCGGPDLNRRIPTEMDSESIAFDQARQPPLSNRGIIL